MPAPVHLKVVGMVAGDREHAIWSTDVGHVALLIPEPDNPHDPNAIAVYTAPRWQYEQWPVEKRHLLMADSQVGYVPKAIAAQLSLPNEGVEGTVSKIRYKPDTEDPIGCDVEVPGLMRWRVRDDAR